MVDIQPGTKLWNLGLRKVDLSTSELSRQRDELEEMRIELSHKMKQRQMALIREEELRIQELQRQKEEIRRQEALEKQKLEAARAALAPDETWRQPAGHRNRRPRLRLRAVKLVPGTSHVCVMIMTRVNLLQQLLSR